MSVVANNSKQPVSRISISLPEHLLSDLDRMVEEWSVYGDQAHARA